MRLPPTSSLEALAAVARLGSFTAAGAELGLSLPALSRRIGAIETGLGVSLFVRHARGVQLTSVGLAYVARVETALGLLHSARDTIARADRATARLTTIPGFATQWLLPRLPAFCKAHPDIDVDVRTSFAFENLEAMDFDLAIRCSLESTAEADLLLPIHLLPVWNKTCVEDIVDPASVVLHPLLGPDHRPEFWAEWLSATGQKAPSRPIRSVEGLLLYDLAMNGCGVAIGIEPLVDNFIGEGRLACLSSRRIRSERSFFLLARQARPPRAVRLLRDWLMAEAATSKH